VIGGPGSQSGTRVGQVTKSGFDPMTELGGPLLQQSSISVECAELVPPMANTSTLRLTPGVMGYGLVEAIPDAAILAVRDAQPEAQLGRERFVAPLEAPGESRIGRFGWKAHAATILTFSGDAGLNELGLTNRLVPTENDPNGDDPPSNGAPDFCDEVPDPEDGPDKNGRHFIDRITDFQRFLAFPPQTPKSGMSGEVVFNDIGCAVCHHPSFTTADDPALEDAIRNKTIRPYSDFLVHDVGQASDFFPDGPVTAREIRTTPLAGLRVRGPLWHDGRFAAGSFEERVTAAILDHGALGSQGIPATEAFQALSPADKDALFAFLDSLGRAEFDTDGDNDVELDDFTLEDGFMSCFGGGPYTADDPCALHDVDQDGDVDFDDYDVFVTVYEGPLDDCNANGVDDLEDLLNGTSTDNNQNGIPDDCEPCVEDIDGSGSVNVDDLVELILAWGPCPVPPAACPADVTGNGSINVDDLIQVLLAWGDSCP
jgi:hypothetical protein